MSSRLSALLVWGLVAASVVFWILRLSASPTPVPDAAVLATERIWVGGDLSALLGAPAAGPGAPVAAAPPPAASRFRLTGVVATSAGRRPQASSAAPGVALISVDGAPPRAYRVGEMIVSNLALHSVALRTARIGDQAAGNISFVLELPPPAAASTGRLSAGETVSPAAPAPGIVMAPMAQPPLPDEQAAPAPGGIPVQRLSPQTAPGFQVQGLPPGVQLPQPGMRGGEEASRTMRQ